MDEKPQITREGETSQEDDDWRDLFIRGTVLAILAVLLAAVKLTGKRWDDPEGLWMMLAAAAAIAVFLLAMRRYWPR
jgi:hypothetical protein